MSTGSTFWSSAHHVPAWIGSTCYWRSCSSPEKNLMLHWLVAGVVAPFGLRVTNLRGFGALCVCGARGGRKTTSETKTRTKPKETQKSPLNNPPNKQNKTRNPSENPQNKPNRNPSKIPQNETQTGTKTENLKKTHKRKIPKPNYNQKTHKTKPNGKPKKTPQNKTRKCPEYPTNQNKPRKIPPLKKSNRKTQPSELKPTKQKPNPPQQTVAGPSKGQDGSF